MGKQIKRERSLFDGSRLYRQAEEGSRTILGLFTNQKLPFLSIIQGLTNGSAQFRVKDKAECLDVLEKIRLYAWHQASKVSPNIAIPILFQAISEYYYGEDKHKYPIWLGTALKVSLALVWKNLYSPNVNETKSINDLTETVKAASVLEQFFYIVDLYDIFSEGDSEYRGNGLYTSDNKLWEGYVELKKTFEKRGRAFRTLEDSHNAITLKPEEAINAIENVLGGSSPSNQPIFQGTVFSFIPQETNPEFWACIWARLKLMLLSAFFRVIVTGEFQGMSIFQDIGITFPPGINRDLLNKGISSLFWKQSWYEKRIKGAGWSLNNLVVERPVARATKDLNLFVTSPILIAESINWFIEESIMRYQGRGGIPIAEAVFKACIADPFEEKVCEVFRKYLFVAGQVTEQGVWMIDRGKLGISEILQEQVSHNTGYFNLSTFNNERSPGEIDVLAYNPFTKELFVVECKVLGMPITKNRVQNVMNKIGQEDSDGFHLKLKRKVEWVRKTYLFKFLHVSYIKGLLVLDRKMPGMFTSDNIVLDYESLQDLMKKFYE